MTGVTDIQDTDGFKSSVKNAGGSLSVVHFSASWAPQCQQMHEVVTELAKDSQYSTVNFIRLEAEDLPEISEQFEIAAVPTFIFIKDEKQVDRIDGANAADLSKKVKDLLSRTSITVPEPPQPQKEDINTRLKRLTTAGDVMLFMKGTPAEPRCGFSKQVVQILKDSDVKYSSFNILTDDEVRQGLKTYSNWPTYPQLYAKGELIGGFDIIKELAESGELKEQLPKQQSLNDRLKDLIKQCEVTLFMKGDRNTPKCGFSQQTIAILNNTGVEYKTFDILTDEEVRQGLKKFSDWPTYPQLYVKGELIGGLDIIKELQESGELVTILKEGQ